VTFAFIEAERANFGIRFMCTQLGVSTSGFYGWRAAQTNPCRRTRDNAELVETIKAIHAASRESYGSPRVTDELRLGLGRRVNHKRVERLMRVHGVRACNRLAPRALAIGHPGDGGDPGRADAARPHPVTTACS
jgi:putative transposase